MNNIVYTNTCEVEFKGKKPLDSWMKDWTEEQRIEKFFEFCQKFDDRNDDLYFIHPINSRGYFERFNLRDLYYQYESRRQQYTVKQRVTSWEQNNEQFVW
jgi:hypothetical protein